MNEVEAIALSGLCSPNAHIRWLSLQILKSIYALGRQDNWYSISDLIFYIIFIFLNLFLLLVFNCFVSVAKIMESFSKDMLQRARFRLLLDSAYGVDQNIQFVSSLSFVSSPSPSFPPRMSSHLFK